MLPRYSLGVLKRIRVSKWVRLGLLTVILAFCSYGLALEWPQVRPALGRAALVLDRRGAWPLRWQSAGCMMLAWRRLLADLGSKLPVPVAARVTFMAQLGKYVPGAVWSFAAHVELGHDYDVPRRRGAASVIVGLAARGRHRIAYRSGNPAPRVPRCGQEIPALSCRRPRDRHLPGPADHAPAAGLRTEDNQAGAAQPACELAGARCSD